MNMMINIEENIPNHSQSIEPKTGLAAKARRYIKVEIERTVFLEKLSHATLLNKKVWARFIDC